MSPKCAPGSQGTGPRRASVFHPKVFYTRVKKLLHVAVEGTKNILSSIPKHCKVVFPSTHVVYEGKSDSVQNITEKEPPSPVLSYPKSKVENEKQIIIYYISL